MSLPYTSVILPPQSIEKHYRVSTANLNQSTSVTKSLCVPYFFLARPWGKIWQWNKVKKLILLYTEVLLSCTTPSPTTWYSIWSSYCIYITTNNNHMDTIYAGKIASNYILIVSNQTDILSRDFFSEENYLTQIP